MFLVNIPIIKWTTLYYVKLCLSTHVLRWCNGERCYLVHLFVSFELELEKLEACLGQLISELISMKEKMSFHSTQSSMNCDSVFGKTSTYHVRDSTLLSLTLMFSPLHFVFDKNTKSTTLFTPQLVCCIDVMWTILPDLTITFIWIWSLGPEKLERLYGYVDRICFPSQAIHDLALELLVSYK